MAPVSISLASFPDAQNSILFLKVQFCPDIHRGQHRVAKLGSNLS